MLIRHGLIFISHHYGSVSGSPLVVRRSLIVVSGLWVKGRGYLGPRKQTKHWLRGELRGRRRPHTEDGTLSRHQGIN